MRPEQRSGGGGDGGGAELPRLFGMVHVGALPGTPFASHSIEEICGVAAEEAGMLASLGYRGIIVENMHDRPYVHGAKPPEIVAAMTRAVLAVRAAAPEAVLGVQVLSGGNKEAIAVALAAGAQFIRCENFVFSHIADEGLLERAEAGELLRYRRAIGAEHIRIFADIKKKHASHAITADVTVADAVEGAAFFGADGVIITGTATGKAAAEADIAAARSAAAKASVDGSLPVLVGSGVTPENAAAMLAHADSLIVGSFIKKQGRWENGIDRDRAGRMLAAVSAARTP